jgi:hypothetical protein
MWDKIKDLFRFWSRNGMYLPAAYDHDKKGPSVTLLYAYTAHFAALWGIVWLVIDRRALGVLAAIGYSLAIIGYYLMRRLKAFSVNVKEGKFGAEAEDDEDETKKEKEDA